MNIPVKSYAHRIFPKMEDYHKFGSSDKNYTDYPLILESDEIPIGVYENMPNQIKKSIIITDKGLHYCAEDNYSEKVYYEDVLKTSISEDKFTVTVLDIHLKNNKIFYLPIKRSPKNSKFSDLFNFMRFIDNILSDCRISPS